MEKYFLFDLRVSGYDFEMGKPYGNINRNVKNSKPPKQPGGEAFKIKLRGKDNAPLSMAEVQQGLLESIRKLRSHQDLRAKWVTVYLTFIDEDGKEASPDPKGEWELFPYKSAADEFQA